MKELITRFSPEEEQNFEKERLLPSQKLFTSAELKLLEQVNIEPDEFLGDLGIQLPRLKVPDWEALKRRNTRISELLSQHGLSEEEVLVGVIKEQEEFQARLRSIRFQKGKVTGKQFRLLVDLEVDRQEVWSMSKSEASAAIASLIRERPIIGWRIQALVKLGISKESAKELTGREFDIVRPLLKAKQRSQQPETLKDHFEGLASGARKQARPKIRARIKALRRELEAERRQRVKEEKERAAQEVKERLLGKQGILNGRKVVIKGIGSADLVTIATMEETTKSDHPKILHYLPQRVLKEFEEIE